VKPAPPSPTRLLITADEAAAALSISTRKLWSLTTAGVIPCVRLGRSVRYSPAELQDWIQAQRRSSP
jgi:excisionase family DNA binding protein